MCVLIYSITFVGSVLFLRRTERDVIKYMCWSSCKVLIILVRLVKFEFLDRFSKNTRISNFMKIRPMGTELFHADRRTNRHDKTNSRFSHLCEERLKYSLFQTLISKWKKLTDLITYPEERKVFDNEWKFTPLAPLLYALLQFRLVSTLARLRTPLFWDLTPCHWIIRSRLREGT